LPNLAAWLRSPGALDRVEQAVALIAAAAESAPIARRFLHRGAAARRLAASTVLDVANAAADGAAAAQALMPYLPRVLLAKHASTAALTVALVGSNEGEKERIAAGDGDAVV